MFINFLSGLLSLILGLMPVFAAGTSYNLSDPGSFSAAWYGGAAGDQLSYSGTLDEGVQLLDADCDGENDDLFLIASQADGLGRTDNGAVYFVRNAGSQNGPLSLLAEGSFSAAWYGGTSGDQLGFTNNSGQSVQLVNADGDACADDIVITSVFADVGGRIDNGAIYMIRDAVARSGVQDLADVSSYSTVWFGAYANDRLGDTGRSGLGVQFVTPGTGDPFLLVTTANADVDGRVDAGAVYLIKQPASRATEQDLAVPASYNVAWFGASAGDQIGGTDNRAQSVKVVNLIGLDSPDLLVSAPGADLSGRIDNGAVYLLADVAGLSGQQVLSQTGSYQHVWYGGADGDRLGSTFVSGEAVVPLGAINGFALVVPRADTLGRVDNGAIYLVADVGQSPVLNDLALPESVATRFDGASSGDQLGGLGDRASAIQVVAVDGDSQLDDLLINATAADIGGLDGNGAVYLIKNFTAITGLRDLSQETSFNVRWSGGTSLDRLGRTHVGENGMILADVDGVGGKNDLLLIAYLADFAGLNNRGAVYLVKNINTLSGTRSLADSGSFDVAWLGGRAGDQLGGSDHSGSGVQLATIDGSGSGDDLLFTVPRSDVDGFDSGSVYLVKNIGGLSGLLDLSVPGSFTARWGGAGSGDKLGFTDDSGLGVQLVDADGDISRTDLLISSLYASETGPNAGALYLVQDVRDATGVRVLGNPESFSKKWLGGYNGDQLGNATDSGQAVKVVNVDGGRYANDVLISSSLVNAVGLANNGAVYLLRNVLEAPVGSCQGESLPSRSALRRFINPWCITTGGGGVTADIKKAPADPIPQEQVDISPAIE